MRIALIGYGAIARAVHAELRTNARPLIRQVLVRETRCAAIRQETGDDIGVISSVDALHPDTRFVLECAGHEAVRAYGAGILARGISLGIVSAGVLADEELHRALRKAAAGSGAQLVVLPGAIGGTDAIAAAGRENLTMVTYTGRKPPMAWAGSPAEEQFDLAGITGPTVLFSGTAREAARQYPKNANVVATVALAGTGFDDTKVSLVADPAAKGNTHEIAASGPLLDFTFITGGRPLAANPRTSALTAMSAVRTLRNLTGPVVV